MTTAVPALLQNYTSSRGMKWITPFSRTPVTGRYGEAWHVAAERFVFTPAEITVDEGTQLELRITSDDTDHGFRVHGLGDINVAIPKRGRCDVRVTIDARTAGTYVFECSHVCGAGHGFMRGVIRVRPRS